MSNVAPIALKHNPEQAKYEKMWRLPEYRHYAPGAELAPLFLKHAAVTKDSTVIDFGAGTGRGALHIARTVGCEVIMLDFATGCLDDAVRVAAEAAANIAFIHHDLLHPIPVRGDYGFCTDVMEHIQPECVDLVLENILDSARHVFFQISLEHDACGALIDESLHLTVEPMTWWLKKFRDAGAFIYYSEQKGENAIFYVSGQQTRLDRDRVNDMNVDFDTLTKNIKSSVARRLTQCAPSRRQDRELMLLSGGPSLADQEETIKKMREAEIPVICTNGTYNWCLERGIAPSGLIIVDARPSNAKFIKAPISGCKYLFASQCHPDVFDAVPRNQTWIWHNSSSVEVNAFIESQHRGAPWFPVPGGRTVTLRAISLLRMLGWTRLHLFGFDGCLMGDKHHAYDQPENDFSDIVAVEAGGRTFNVFPWMAGQALDFTKQMKAMGGELDLVIHGDGLMAHILKL